MTSNNNNNNNNNNRYKITKRKQQQRDDITDSTIETLQKELETLRNNGSTDEANIQAITDLLAFQKGLIKTRKKTQMKLILLSVGLGASITCTVCAILFQVGVLN